MIKPRIEINIWNCKIIRKQNSSKLSHNLSPPQKKALTESVTECEVMFRGASGGGGGGGGGVWMPWRGLPSRGQRCDARSGRWQLSVTLHTQGVTSASWEMEKKRERRRGGEGEWTERQKGERSASSCACFFFFYLCEDLRVRGFLTCLRA